MATKKISISFSEPYLDVYKFLKSQDNASNYICQLVRSQIRNKDTINPELEAKVEELIKKVLKENNYSYDYNFPTNSTEHIINSLTDDDKSLIKDLF
jgi:hypothetical protein